MLNAVLLVDTYSLNSRKLYDSFQMAGCECPVIVLEENDFLPDGVMSVYDMFLGFFGERGEKSGIGRPRFFDEIEVPDNWSVYSGEGITDYGIVTYRREEKGRIHYLESEKRFLVKAVDWFGKKGNVRTRDHYNRYGAVCARTFYDECGRRLGKTWFSAEGHEAITWNGITGDLIVNDGDFTRFFRAKMDMFLYFFRRMGFEKRQIFYNSLSDPFLISNSLTAPEKWDILFWQNDIGDAIPENMQMILNGQTTRTGRILVQRRDSYNRLLELGVDSNIVQKMGYLYEFKKENGHRPQALICTNSDRIEHCEELVREFPEMHFHIAAVTLMSSKLMDMGRYNNVSLYPGVQVATLEELFNLCDYYFDINYESEIVSAVYQAFMHNQLIFAFEETAHNRMYLADNHVYPIEKFDRLIAEVREILVDRQKMEHHLQMQWKDAMVEEKAKLRGCRWEWR